MSVTFAKFGAEARGGAEAAQFALPGSEAAETEVTTRLATVLTGNFSGNRLATPPPALEYIQAGADITASLLGARINVARIVGEDYFMNPIVGLEGRYIAGRAGIMDFSSSLGEIVTDQQDVVMIAHILYGAYNTGRLLLPRAIPRRNAVFKELKNTYLDRHEESNLEEAEEVLCNRIAATVALDGIKYMLDNKAKQQFITAILHARFPDTTPNSAAVALDFQRHIKTKVVAQILGKPNG